MDEILNRDHIDLAELKENDKKSIDIIISWVSEMKNFLSKNLDDHL